MKFHWSVVLIALALFRFVSSGGFTLPHPFAADEPVPPGMTAAYAAKVAQKKVSRPWTLRAPAEPPADNRNYAPPAVAAAFEPVHQAAIPAPRSSAAVWMVLRHHAQLDQAREQKREAEHRAEMENRQYQKALQRSADERRQYHKDMQRSADQRRADLAAIERAGSQRQADFAAIERSGAERRSQAAAAAAAAAERGARARADQAAADARRAAERARRPY